MNPQSFDNKIKKRLIHQVLEEYRRNGINKAGLNRYMLKIKHFFDSDDMAVVGIFCEYPDAKNPIQFWDNLVNERESIKQFPESRVKDFKNIFNLQKRDTRKGGFIDRIDEFDADYFNIPPRVAVHLDPYHRKMLEVTVKCIEDAGYTKEQLYGSRTGVFIGHDHTHRLVTSFFDFIADVDFTTIIGAWTGILASRISYLFNFSGPALVLDSGCSSSMVAIDSAIASIKNGNCDAAFVGGINLFFLPDHLDKGAQSEDYRVRAFDKAANGTIWSEGIASIYIKPLDAAVQDRDHIYGIIKGSALNNDGKSSSLTAPNGNAQRNVILNAWKNAEVHPESISYVEAHGTGTILGDPIEIKALTDAFKTHTSKNQFCGIGSVKNNIGHTVGLSGMTSLIKVLLSFDYGKIPSTINFSVPNPYVDFCNSPFYLQEEAYYWRKEMKQITVGVSAFSFTGTNSHMVLESYETEKLGGDYQEWFCFPISAKNRKLLLKTIENYIFYLESKRPYGLRDIAFTMSCGRKHLSERAAIVSNHKDGLLDAFRKLKIYLLTHKNGSFCRLKSDTYRIYYGIMGGGEESNFNQPSPITDLALSFIRIQEVDFEVFFKDRDVFKCSLPPTEFDSCRFWDESVKKIVKPKNKPVREEISSLDEIIRNSWSLHLGYSVIEENASFFELGGDSIVGSQIVYTINSALNLSLAPVVILKYPIYSEFCCYIRKVKEGIPDQEIKSSKKLSKKLSYDNYQKAFPLISAQKGMFLTNQIAGDSLAYNIVAVWNNEDNYGLNEINSAISHLVRSHAALRTHFMLEEGYPIQVINSDLQAEAEYHELLIGDGVHEAIKNYLKQIIVPFSIEHAPLFRIHYLNYKNQKSYVVFDFHHLIADGTSMGILLHQFVQYLENRQPFGIGSDYREAIMSIYEKEHGTAILEHKNWWNIQYKDKISALNLPTDKTRSSLRDYSGNKIIKQITAKQLEKMKELAFHTETTLYMVMIGALYSLMNRLNGEEVIVIGTPTTGRTTAESLSAVGMFVNTLALRLSLNQQVTVKEYLAQVKQTVVQSFEHQDYNYEMLLEDLDLPRNASNNPLFDLYFSLQNIDMGIDEEVELIEFESESAKFDLTIVARPLTEGIYIEWEYCTSLFNESTINRLAERYLILLDHMSNSPDKKMCELDIFLPKELEEINRYFMIPSRQFLSSDNLVMIFEQMVRLHGERPALFYEKALISYRELNRRANCIAEVVIASLSGKNLPVALMFEKSADMIAAILGVLKAGCYYVPVDINNPEARIQKMIDDSDSRVILSHKQLCRNIKPSKGEVIYIENIDLSWNAHNPNRHITKTDIAYMIYTSGTTGQPKGTLIRHESLLRLTKENDYLKCTYKDRMLQCANYCFDASVFEIFTALLNGAALVIVNKNDIMNIEILGDIIKKYSVNMMLFTTTLFNLIIDVKPEILNSVEKILFGGESASAPHVKKAYDLFGPGRLMNCYGPTEACVIATAYLADRKPVGSKIPIGRPIGDTSVYILDKNQRIQPIGFPGELYIGGIGVSAGYYNREELNERFFIRNPYNPDEILYKTGDLAVLDESLNIYYMGRRDHQVKLRGFRIETSELEHTALNSGLILEGHCEVVEDGKNSGYICLWVVPNSLYEHNKLKNILAANLPVYMLPAQIVEIDRMPINSSGKVDVSKLKPIVYHESQIVDKPENLIQNDIRKVWTHVLGLEEIGIRENFFAIGGDSIKAIQIVSLLQKNNYYTTVSGILQNQTIEQLSQNIEIKEPEVYEQGIVFGNCTPSPIQQLYLENGDFISRFNQSLHMRLKHPVTLQALKQAVSRIILHHDALRLRIDSYRNLFIESPDNSQLFYCEEIDANRVNKDKEAYYISLQERVSPIDGPLVAVSMFIENGCSNIVIAIHHLAVDVVSWAIIMEDLENCLMVSEYQIPLKTTPFKEWTDYYYQAASKGGLRFNLPYWINLAQKQKEYSGKVEIYPLSAGIKYLDFVIWKDATSEQIKRLNFAYHTKTHHLLLTVLGRSTAKWLRTNAVLINLEGHGRDDGSGPVNVLRTVGWFTSCYPFMVELAEPLTESIKKVKEDFNAIPNNGYEYMGLRMFDSKLDPAKQNMLNELKPIINFNFLGKQQSYINDNLEIIRLPQKITVDDSYQNDYLIDITASLSDNKLNIEMAYRTSDRGQYFIGELVKIIKEEFDAVKRSCFSVHTQEKTASDYSASDINQDDLEDIWADITG